MTIQVDIISDVVCPWCYIGKRHLEEALRRVGEEASVVWHPFQLNPDTPEDGDAYLPFLEHKFGGTEQVRRIWERTRQAGIQAGIEFAFERIAIRPNTLKAHRLIRRAQRNGQADALVERLFAGHFLLGEDIGSKETLARIAAELGDDPAAVRAYLASDEDADQIQDEIVHAEEMGVGGVPFFIFNRRVGVSGAQPADVLVQAIQEASK
ncbi:MAG TPA: DsbA family oxidoreductase [Rhodocyclaceae bacterium]|nr:DsbA family oxidoreductase [Rhodocyclaceae bacterium]